MLTPIVVAYSASKGAITALTLPMTRDLARYGIRVVTIAPSLFDSRMTSMMSDKVRASLKRVMEFPRMNTHFHLRDKDTLIRYSEARATARVRTVGEAEHREHHAEWCRAPAGWWYENAEQDVTVDKTRKFDMYYL
jgi:NAD(P)-dependent dehydrogenase (short-subunit alcohol dehydrogenase family)